MSRQVKTIAQQSTTRGMMIDKYVFPLQKIKTTNTYENNKWYSFSILL